MSSLQLTEFVKRPGVGKLGIPVNVRSNFFEVTQLPRGTIYHYDLSISNDVPPPVARRIFEQLLASYRASDLEDIQPVYDGRKSVFSAKALPFESRTFDVSLNPDVVPRPNRAVQVFKVKLKKVATINLEELHRFLDGTAAMSNNCLTAIMSLDILIRHMPAMLYATVGRSFYTPTGSQPLPGPLEVWRGYYQSARPTPGKMMINVDVSANAFYQGIPLLEMVMKILNLRSQDDLRRSSPPLNWVKVERIIKQLRITTTHRGTTQRSFKIERLTKNSAKDETFTIQTEPPSGQGEVVEKETNIAAYFQETYNRTLSFPTLPCVKLGRTAIVPMEVCKVVAGQRYPKKLDEAQTAEMIKFTSQNPAARANTIKEGLKTLNYDENPRLKDFGMKVSSEMAVIKARVLPAPTVAYNRTSPREASFVPRGGAWNLKDKKFVQPAVLGAWGVVVFGSERECPVPMVQSFVREFTNCGTACGMNIVNKSPPITFANPHGDVEMALKNLWVQTGNSVKSKPQLLVCVLPNTGTPLYAEIKRVTDTVIGVASQCLQMKHVKAAKTQYCANVCLKVNVKLGGSNADLGPNMMPFITSRPTIVIGADVSHPAPMDTTRPSIAAVVGSTDSKATRYAATVRIQTARTETISDLSDMIIELLKAFYQTCGRKPERILVYRDGLSEGQFSNVLKTEVESLRAGCRRLDDKYSPAITFVVVQKRHHARFFPMSSQAADRSGNCQAGTCVDTTIVHPFDWDFYIQSHAGLLGTSRPAHYYVLQDDSKFTPDDLQSLTYNLCHLYARATRTVSYVPAAYYAHIVAARARFHARGEQFSDTMSGESASTIDSSSYAAVKSDLIKVMWYM